ncbi:MBOAT family protein [Reichenbachiella agarivorans]|uniref:MBOAT family protein n=1 Tax=Reichenbachiella agarivorans TaxID=2979464 RepID=A0ABY6CQY9_9BACT|nr:MBOAT family O-acyltransferase [Reichenbachiella agarivorans]UXP32934.1 MBOAT family protein [Reichenbachiella agarivorans]
MLFNSAPFIFFIIIVFGLFVIVKPYRWAVLLISSYFFYMSWKWEYAMIIFVSTIIDYFCALKIKSSASSKNRKLFLGLSLFTNLSILFFFKYFEFFIHSISDIFGAQQTFYATWLLPVGISFYTFQTMSYTIDVYHGDAQEERHFGKFALFVIYFPQLVAGPIERAGHLINQLKNRLQFKSENLLPAARYFIFGLFKKVVIADRVALLIDPIYNHPSEHGGYLLIAATVLFAFQIYCDFSGYTDMAIGISRLFNVELMKNFDTPYFATSVTRFWRKWHISLSSWFKDYIYIPLGGSKVVKWRWAYNIFITFVISGLWHGANWTFIVWGAYHGLWLIIEKWGPKLVHTPVIRIPLTFLIVNIGWMIFRANHISDVGLIFNQIAFHREDTEQIIADLTAINFSKLNLLITIYAIGILLIKDLFDSKIKSWRAVFFYLVVCFSIICFGMNESQAFIYFQF